MRERLSYNDLERYDLYGKVKSMTYIEYEPRYNSDTTYTLKIYDFLSMKNHIAMFDEKGYLEKKIELFSDLNDSLSESAIWTYKYDKNNRIVREFRDSKRFGDTTSWNYQYFDNNTTVIKEFSKTFHVLYYKYVQNENIELLTTANSDSSYQRTIKFIYDKQNRLVRKEDFENKDTIVNLRILKYNDESLNYGEEIIEVKKYKHLLSKSFKYDANGNMKEIYDSHSKLIGTFEYVYDKNKNWTEQRCYNANGRLYNVYKRTLVYY